MNRDGGSAESEMRYSLIFHNAPIGILHFNTAGIITECNDAFVEIIGSSREVLVGLDMLRLPDKRIVDLVKVALSGTTGRLEGAYSSVTADKTSLGRVIFSPILDSKGKALGGIGVVEDVTEREQAREELKKANRALEQSNDDLKSALEKLEYTNSELMCAQDELVEANELLYESERLYRALFDNSADAILLLDGKFIDCNNQACRLYGLPWEELVGRHPAELSPEFQLDGRSSRKAADEYIEKAISGKPMFFQWRHLRGDGSSIDVEVSLARVMIKGRAHVITSVRDISERIEAERLIQESLAEKEILIKEIHHRVKNNLQVISSLLSLQSRFVRNPEDLAIFTESQDRVRSMALVHEKLYQTGDFTRIDFREYLKSMLNELRRSYSGTAAGVDFKINIDNVHLSIEKAIPCGLIITELVSNSLKYAFPTNRGGEIGISMSLENGRMLLVVSDNGDGMPPDLDWKTSSTLGLQLVNSLVKQLKGDVVCINEEGTEFRISFPDA